MHTADGPKECMVLRIFLALPWRGLLDEGEGDVAALADVQAVKAVDLVSLAVEDADHEERGEWECGDDMEAGEGGSTEGRSRRLVILSAGEDGADPAGGRRRPEGTRLCLGSGFWDAAEGNGPRLHPRYAYIGPPRWRS
jgi:hypothetical protein